MLLRFVSKADWSHLERTKQPFRVLPERPRYRISACHQNLPAIFSLHRMRIPYRGLDSRWPDMRSRIRSRWKAKGPPRNGSHRTRGVSTQPSKRRGYREPAIEPGMSTCRPRRTSARPAGVQLLRWPVVGPSRSRRRRRANGGSRWRVSARTSDAAPQSPARAAQKAQSQGRARQV